MPEHATTIRAYRRVLGGDAELEAQKDRRALGKDPALASVGAAR
jgi:hypothetical protein